MPNPLFQMFGGNSQNPMLQQFSNFMQQMQGKDPSQVINEMVSSGKLTQQQLDQAQKQAQQMKSIFEPIKNQFRF